MSARGARYLVARRLSSGRSTGRCIAESDDAEVAPPSTWLPAPVRLGETRLGAGQGLTVGHAEDPEEQRAERVADSVLARLSLGGHPATDPESGRASAAAATVPAPAARRLAAGAGSPAAVGREGGALDAGSSSEITARLGGGSPIPESLRRSMEGAFGRGFTDVRLHTDAPAARLSAQLSARAFTVGRDVFFGAGEYQPGTAEGRHTLAHELAHSVGGSESGLSPLRRKMRGTADAVQNLGGDKTSGTARKLTKNRTNWDLVLHYLHKYERMEVKAVQDATRITSLRPKMVRALDNIAAAIASWRVSNDQAGADALTDASHQVATKKFDKRAMSDDRTKATRRQAIALIEPRIANERRLLMDKDTTAWTRSLGLSPHANPTTGGSDAGQKNVVQELTYGQGDDAFSGYFKQDVGFTNKPESHELKTGIRQHDPNYGARSVAMYRLDGLLSAGVTARAEFAIHTDKSGKNVMGTLLETAQGRKTENIRFGITREHADMLGDDSVALDDPVLQRALNKLQILDAIAGQLDRHQGNYRIRTNGKGKVQGVTGIDLDMAFGRDMDTPGFKSAFLSDNYKGLPPSIDKEMGETILRLTDKDIADTLAGILPPAEVNATVSRFIAVQKAVKAAQDNGELVDQWDSKTAQKRIKGADTPYGTDMKSYFDVTAASSYAFIAGDVEAKVRDAFRTGLTKYRVGVGVEAQLSKLPKAQQSQFIDECAAWQTGIVTTYVSRMVFDENLPPATIDPLIGGVMRRALPLERVTAVVDDFGAAANPVLSKIFTDKLRTPFYREFPGLRAAMLAAAVTGVQRGAARRKNVFTMVGGMQGRPPTSK